MEMDSFISELGQPELYLSVYDTNQKLVFKTQNEYDKLLQLIDNYLLFEPFLIKPVFIPWNLFFKRNTRKDWLYSSVL